MLLNQSSLKLKNELTTQSTEHLFYDVKMVLQICFPEFAKLSYYFGITGTKQEKEDRLIESLFGRAVKE